MTWNNESTALIIGKMNDSYCTFTAVNCSSQSDTVDIHCDTGGSVGFYTELVFWGFVATFTLGSMGYNVANSVSDAICFDVLGELVLFDKARLGLKRPYHSTSVFPKCYCIEPAL